MNARHVPPFKYPHTRYSDQQDVFYGTVVPDPYRWLEDDRSEETTAWVEQQNKVTAEYLSRIPFRESLKERLTKVWNYEKFSAPFKEGAYTYFYKNDGLQHHYVLYRQKDDSEAEVFLDPNTFSKDGTTSLAGISFTRDGSLCAYLVSEGGSDWTTMIIMDAVTMQIMKDTIKHVKFSGIAWKQNEGLYYSNYDLPTEGSQLSGKTEQHKLLYHKLNTPQEMDTLVFGGAETPRRYISGSITEDEQFLVITAANATSGNELYIQDISKPAQPIVPVVTGFETEQDVLYSKDGKLFILTNLNAPNRKVVITDANQPAPAYWQDLIPESAFPLSASTGGEKIFAHYLKDAVSHVEQFSLQGQKELSIELPGLGSAGGFSAKREEQDVYYSFSSYVYPPTIFRYHIPTATSEVYKRSNVDFDPALYESKQVFYTSAGGTRVPMIVTHKKALELNGNHPTLLYGYGGFNISVTPAFSISNTVFMEHGGIYAVANIRGGGEYGDEWHRAGTKMRKQNVFDDFIAAAEYLIKEHYTSREYLAISGGSNGGLLVGACMTQRPELFKVALPAVGVLDMLRYHNFTAGAGWAFDYGTADESEEMFRYLLDYSPLHAIRPGTCYPSTMIFTADHDDRVVPAHSFKFAATLQAAQGCNAPVLVRIDTKAGHGAGKPTAMIIDEVADKFAFLFCEMGIQLNLEHSAT